MVKVETKFVVAIKPQADAQTRSVVTRKEERTGRAEQLLHDTLVPSSSTNKPQHPPTSVQDMYPINRITWTNESSRQK